MPLPQAFSRDNHVSHLSAKSSRTHLSPSKKLRKAAPRAIRTPDECERVHQAKRSNTKNLWDAHLPPRTMYFRSTRCRKTFFLIARGEFTTLEFIAESFRKVSPYRAVTFLMNFLWCWIARRSVWRCNFCLFIGLSNSRQVVWLQNCRLTVTFNIKNIWISFLESYLFNQNFVKLYYSMKKAATMNSQNIQNKKIRNKFVSSNKNIDQNLTKNNLWTIPSIIR